LGQNSTSPATLLKLTKGDYNMEVLSRKTSIVILIVTSIIGFILACMFLLTYLGIYDLLPEDAFIEKAGLGSLLLICLIVIIIFGRSIRKQQGKKSGEYENI
jgi:hypothetical protein